MIRFRASRVLRKACFPERSLKCLFLLLFVSMAVPSFCPGEAARSFRIGTGGILGAYYPIGKLIAQGLTQFQAGPEGAESSVPASPGFVGVAQSSSGSVANVRALASGEIEAGLVQADVAAWAFNGSGVFAGDKKIGSLRAVASLYSEKLQIVTRKDADIGSIAELRGKRISIDEVGSGTLSVMRLVLEEHGMSEKDFRAVYLKPEFTYEKMRNGEIDGFAIMAGAPIEAVDRVSDLGLRLVPIAPEIAARIHAKFSCLVPGVIPAEVYPGIPQIPTLQVHALLVVRETLADHDVYLLNAALWNKRTLCLLHNGHPMGRLMELRNALDGISIPLHPGAELFYRKQGMLPIRIPSL